MACVEDCDQILIASSIKESQGWEENGNKTTTIIQGTRYVDIYYLFVSESFQAEEECGGDWAVDTVDSLARAGQDWGSWDAADQDSSSSAPSTNTVTENVFDIMRDGSLSQVRPSINIFYIHTQKISAAG